MGILRIDEGTLSLGQIYIHNYITHNHIKHDQSRVLTS